jgi:hypothetical protein
MPTKNLPHHYFGIENTEFLGGGGDFVRVKTGGLELQLIKKEQILPHILIS